MEEKTNLNENKQTSYINVIDSIIDNNLDNFFLNIINVVNTPFNNILNDMSFVKYQKQLTDILKDFTEKIDISELENILNSKENVKRIIEIITRYIAYYIFIFIAYHYKWSKDTYINNVIDFSKNQSSYDFKITDFYDSSNNAAIIKFYDLVKSVLYVFGVKEVKNSVLITTKGKEIYKDALQFLSLYDEDIINDKFKTEIKEHTDINKKKIINYVEFDKTDDMQKNKVHNLIKTIVYEKIYIEKEKQEIFRILDEIEKEKGEYTYIDIVYEKTKYIDQTSIEKVLQKKYNRNSKLNIESIYNLLNNVNNKISDMHEFANSSHTNEELKKLNILMNEDKISYLINNNILIPIVEDFMLLHKDLDDNESEQDIKDTVSKQVIFDKKIKKDETKLQSVVNRIENASELYSPNANKTEIDKIFYPPLRDRNVIIINNREDIKLIIKLSNQQKYAISELEQYKDLINYSYTTYLNFKHLSRPGFPLHLNKTIKAIRYVSLVNMDNKNFDNNLVEIRGCGINTSINIVGFVLNSNNNLHTANLIKLKDLTNISNMDNILKNYVNGNNFMNSVNYIYDTIYNNKTYKPAVWLFNPNTDIPNISTYEHVPDINGKMLLYSSYIFDSLQELSNNLIIKEITNYKNEHNKIDLEICNNIMNDVFDKVVPLNRNNVEYINLTHFIYDLITVNDNLKNEIDEDHDTYNVKNTIILPNANTDFIVDKSIVISPYKPRKLNPFFGIKDLGISDLAPDDISIDDILYNEEIYAPLCVDAKCHHFIQLKDIIRLRKKKQILFQKKMYEFIQRYATKNIDKDYICKSCATVLDIKDYIADGYFDNEDGKFITLSIPITVILEDMPEYSKYKQEIKNLDKYVEKIASICGLTIYVGSTQAVKNRRTGIVKDLIDIIALQYRTYKQKYKQRNVTLPEKYNINTNITNFYVFDLDVSIFLYTTKDKDYYKMSKINNIICYIIFLMIIDISESHLYSINMLKVCNYIIFNNVAYSKLFKDLKFVRNVNGDIEKIGNYKILCYLIYMFSGIIIFNHQWYFEGKRSIEDSKKRDFTDKSLVDIKAKSNKFDVAVQITMIHTFMDVLNSILEGNISNSKNNINPTYNILASKFYAKLIKLFEIESNVFINLSKLHRIDKKSNNLSNKEIFEKLKDTQDYPTITMTGKYDFNKIIENTKIKYFNYNPLKYLFSYKYKILQAKLPNISILTNCPNGKFHSWKADGNDIKCKICSSSYSKLKNNIENNSENNAVYENYINLTLHKLSERYCVSGSIHNYNINTNACLLCNYKKNDKLSESDLIKLIGNLENKKIEYFSNNKIISNYTDLTKSTNLITTTNYDVIYKLLINKMEEINGSNVSSIKNNLKNNIYIIDYDYVGNSMLKPIHIIDNNTKIKYQYNNTHFNSDVIYYTDKSVSHIDVYYNPYTLLYLGYKENHKDYINSNEVKPNFNIYIKFVPSLYTKLINLGYPSRYINITKKNTTELATEFIVNIIKERTNNLKNCVVTFIKILNNIFYNSENLMELQLGYNSSEITKISHKYAKTLKGIKYPNNLFNDWLLYNDTVHFKYNKNNFIRIDINDKYVKVDDIIDIDNSGKTIVEYLSNELIYLIDYNTEKHKKMELISLYIDIINYLYNFYSIDVGSDSAKIRIINYALESEKYVNDSKNSDYIYKNDELISIEEMSTQEYIDNEEEIIEENAGFDMDGLSDIENDEENLRFSNED